MRQPRCRLRRMRPARAALERQQGTVTAEAAVVLPVVAAFALALVWVVSLGIAQVRTIDAARDAARGLARGDDERQAIALAERTAPEGATISIVKSGGSVTVSVSLEAKPPGWLLVPLPGVSVGSQSTVEVEDDLATP